MKSTYSILMIAVASYVAATAISAGGLSPAQAPASDLPTWAYPLTPPGPPAPDDGTPKRVPGTAVTFTLSQTRDFYNIPDWHPGDHPMMPDIVARGRRPEPRACGFCHLPNGQGRPENSGLAGLPAGYIVQQMADFKNDLRKSAEPKMGPPAAMIAVAKAVTDAEVAAAAEYFASIRFKPWIKVVETETVPANRVSGWMHVPAEGPRQPIGNRIIEMPVDLERTELRDSASSFIAYVPVGSIKRGATLVTTGGGGKTLRCGTCHGEDLKGLGPAPAIAGRSPSYIVRQLYDLRHGARRGLWADLMKAAVAKLTVEDMVAIAAYTASRTP